MAFLRKLIEDNSGEAEVRQRLEFLLSSARAKAQAFENELNLQFLNPESQNKIQIVGDRAFLYVKEYRVNVTQSVSDEISNVVDQFFDGTTDSVKAGFKGIIDIVFKSILGNSTVGEFEQSAFFVIPENNALVRVDAKMWRYNFASSNIISKAENALTVVFAKSVIDHTTLSVDELLYFVTQTVGSTHKDQVIALINDLKQMWDLLQGITPSDAVQSFARHGVGPMIIER